MCFLCCFLLSELVRGDEFISNSKVVHVMSKKDKQILGIATLYCQLFIVRGGSQQIDIYNTLDFTETGHVTVNGMKRPRCLVACSHYNCLYVSDATGYIHRVELFNKSVSKWTVKGQSCGMPEGLSLTTAHTVIVTLLGANRLHEYTTQGELMRDISLDVDLKMSGHSTQLSTGQFVVCDAGTKHRVCIIDTQGQVVRSYGRDKGSADGQLNGPYSLAVDKTDHVFVADCDNNKVRLFSPSLTHLGDVTLPGYQLNKPCTIHLDQLYACLYVSEDDGERRLFVVGVSSHCCC